MLRSPDAGANKPTARVLVIGCGALARELVGLVRDLGLDHVDVTCLPASLHNRPERIPGAVRARIHQARGSDRRPAYAQIFVAYADCGTGGLLDRVLKEEGVERLGGSHCYEVYAGRAAFARLANVEPGTFYLTDFLVRNFTRLVIAGLGLDRHPELLPVYFGNYRRVVYLAQTDDPSLTVAAAQAARRLGLAFERRYVGLGELAAAIARFRAFPPAVLASGARNGHPRDAGALFAVDPLRGVQHPRPRSPQRVDSVRPMQRTDGESPRPVAYVHQVQRAVRNLRRMQHPDPLSEVGPRSGANSVRSNTPLAAKAR